MPIQTITSIDDERIKPFLNLRTSALPRHPRRFVVEGDKHVLRLLRSDVVVETILCSERRFDELGDGVPDDVLLLLAPHDVVSGIVGYKFHNGVLACGRRPPNASLGACVAPPPAHCLVVVLPSTTNPDNLGSMIRTASAFDVDAVVLGNQCADPFSRRVLRVSMGEGFRLPIIESQDLTRDLQWLKTDGQLEVVASVVTSEAAMLADQAPRGRTALLLGNEAHGLEQEWVESADRHVAIPMAPGRDSLNVSVAAGILLYWLRSGQAGASGAVTATPSASSAPK